MPDQVMVSMPYHDGTDTQQLLRAIRSVQAQTATNVVLVLVADGCRPRDLGLAGRTVAAVHHLRANRGRYFADAVTLRAAVDLGIEYWMVHDSDDWTEPEHVSSLCTGMTNETDVVFGGYVRHNLDGTEQHKTFDVARSRRLRHGTQYAATLWRSNAINSIGGPHPDWRVAWDTMMITLSVTYLRHVIVDSSRYHYEITPGSLTQNINTGMRSQVRRTAHHKRQVVWQQVRRRARSADDVGRIVKSTVAAETLEAVEVEAARLVQELT